VTSGDARSGLVRRMLAGDQRALARLISVVEHGGDGARFVMEQVYAYAGRAWTVGITGPPGAGKSTLAAALAAEWRRRNRRVAIVAVDPSSPFTGGALLGDRIRMQALGGDAGVFMRSMASRGHPGGLARATGDVVRVLDAAGFDIVIVETVGAGQAEVEIAREAHTTVVVEVPGLGDDVQAIKAGILEIADVFVVNKADRPDAEKMRAHLHHMLHLAERAPDWNVPILLAVATRAEQVPALADAAEAHRAFLVASGTLADIERQRAERDLALSMQQLVLDYIETQITPQRRLEVVERIRTHELDPSSAARALLGDALGIAIQT
jgi:LAO/AO transport system kinase